MGEPRNAFHVLWLAVACLVGSATLVHGGRPHGDDVIGDLPLPVQVAWGALMMLGGIAALLGMFWPGDIRTGLVLKRLGYMALLVSTAAFCLDAAFVGRVELLAAGVSAGFMLACAERVVRVEQVIRSAVRASRS